MTKRKLIKLRTFSEKYKDRINAMQSACLLFGTLGFFLINHFVEYNNPVTQTTVLFILICGIMRPSLLD